MKAIYQIFFFLFFLNYSLHAQNEFSKWYFGQGCGLDFSTSPPTILNNGVQSTISDCPTMSDNFGNILFYSDGDNVYNSAHTVMANGNGIGFANSLIAVKQPGNSNLYYVFTAFGNSMLKYSIIDMSLAAGLGSVTVKNATLQLYPCEKLSAVRHCNGKDVWIITHDYNSNQFRTFLLNSAGLVGTPVISPIGPSPAGNNSYADRGAIIISPDGKKLAMAQYSNSVPTSSGSAGFYLFDFDPSSGVLSNSLQLNQASNAVGLEFSPDGKKLYASTNVSGSVTTSWLYQWNLCAGSNAAIIASQYTINLGYALLGYPQRAIDGKIYLSATPQTTASTYSISVINNPNGAGAGMNFVFNGQAVGTNMPFGGLPTFINPYTKPTMLVTETVACQSVNFAAPSATFAGGCSINNYPISSYLWDFGDPSSASANSSTLANPVHSYSATGSYSVKLIVYSNCTNDTILKIVNINALSPVVSVTGNSIICKGDYRIYTASGASTYSWSNSASTNSTAAFSPTSTTVYTVTGTSNGCKSSKTFTVTVEPCQGITSIDNKDQTHVYPNPFTNQLTIDTQEPAELVIIDLAGRIVLTTSVQKGSNSISTGELKAGLYIVECSNSKNVTRFRMVKGE